MDYDDIVKTWNAGVDKCSQWEYLTNEERIEFVFELGRTYGHKISEEVNSGVCDVPSRAITGEIAQVIDCQASLSRVKNMEEKEIIIKGKVYPVIKNLGFLSDISRRAKLVKTERGERIAVRRLRRWVWWPMGGRLHFFTRAILNCPVGYMDSDYPYYYCRYCNAEMGPDSQPEDFKHNPGCPGLVAWDIEKHK